MSTSWRESCRQNNDDDTTTTTTRVVAFGMGALPVARRISRRISRKLPGPGGGGDDRVRDGREQGGRENGGPCGPAALTRALGPGETLYVILALILTLTLSLSTGSRRSNTTTQHNNTPQQQETGRAGRDGLPATCVALVCEADYHRHHSLCHSDGVDHAQILQACCCGCCCCGRCCCCAIQISRADAQAAAPLGA